MTEIGACQIALYIITILIFVKPLGWYMARVYEGQSCGLNNVFGFFERFIYRVCGIQAAAEMNWKKYLSAMLFFNFISILFVFLMQRYQNLLPLNPQLFGKVPADLAFNTATSFVTNTNWQAYAGEKTLSYFTQMTVLTVQNFLSAATGMALLVAFIRGIVGSETASLGNFWVDLTRGILYILIPLSLLLSLVLVSQGVIQNFKPYEKITLLQNVISQSASQNPSVARIEQILPMGPVASQVAIKQLGTNGGGFFNANSAHPFENPTPLSNFFEMVALLLIPAALCYTYGVMVKDTRQGWAILLAMFIIFIPFVFVSVSAEQSGNPKLSQLGVSPIAQLSVYPGGNMEGKESRFGIVSSALWSCASTASANGSVNSMLDSYMPLGGLIPLWFLLLGEIIFGGVGTGLAGMIIFIIMTVFIAGLMVGRTPEYLGKKIEPFEMKMTSFIILILPLIILLATALAAVSEAGKLGIFNSGPHGLTEILYAFSSMTQNNGSAFTGLNANSFFYNTLGGCAMLIGRYWVAIAILAIAGKLALKKIIPSGLGTLPTHIALFIFLLIGVILSIGALTFLPVLALGPIAEQLMLWM